MAACRIWQLSSVPGFRRGEYRVVVVVVVGVRLGTPDLEAPWGHGKGLLLTDVRRIPLHNHIASLFLAPARIAERPQPCYAGLPGRGISHLDGAGGLLADWTRPPVPFLHVTAKPCWSWGRDTNMQRIERRRGFREDAASFHPFRHGWVGIPRRSRASIDRGPVTLTPRWSQDRVAWAVGGTARGFSLSASACFLAGKYR